MKSEQDLAAEVAPSSLQALCPAGVTISRVSLQFSEDATEETIQAVDKMLEEVGRCQLYLVGDYINYLYHSQGEAIARQRIERSYAPESIKVASWVCRHVSTERRLISPSFGHAIEVAKLDPTGQELWLTRARDEGLSTKQLRAELRKSKAIGTNTKNQGPVDQQAARASEAWEVFRAWYQAQSPDFSGEQKAEWDTALLPFVTDYVAHMSREDFERVGEARASFQN